MSRDVRGARHHARRFAESDQRHEKHAESVQLPSTASPCWLVMPPTARRGACIETSSTVSVPSGCERPTFALSSHDCSTQRRVAEDDKETNKNATKRGTEIHST